MHAGLKAVGHRDPLEHGRQLLPLAFASSYRLPVSPWYLLASKMKSMR
jgi:hypothetical protein